MYNGRVASIVCVNAGRIWPAGTTADAAWLDHALGYAGHRAATWFATAFEASCRLGLPAVPVVDGLDQAAHDRAVVQLLSAFGAASWWLGYLDYGIGINIVSTKRRETEYSAGAACLCEQGPAKR